MVGQLSRSTLVRTAVGLLLLVAIGTTLGVLLVKRAQASSGEVTDPVGDAPSPYIDIVKAKLTGQHGEGRLFLMQELAGKVPAAPSEAVMSWAFGLDTLPGSHYAGVNSTAEYIVVLYWRNGGFLGEMLDWTGASPTDQYPTNEVKSSVAFKVSGATVKLWVDMADIGNPCTIAWRSSTRDQGFPSPADDLANGGAGPAGPDPILDLCGG